MFNELSQSLQLKCNNKDVDFIIENPNKNLILDMDFPKISQIITNFATNAIKHTYKGSIRVGYTYDTKYEELEVYVKDTGIGIPEDKKHLVFERFKKLDNSSQGTGLGLAIVKELTTKYGISCGVESKEGEGSYFWAKGKFKKL